MDEQREQDMLDQARQRMLRNDLRGRDITDPRVLRVMMEVPREAFVPEGYRHQAYADGPLPIGAGQTISQPYIVALMTQLLRLDPECEVLEIGTGSGYQTAILARLAARVCTIEKYDELSSQAQDVLRKQAIENVRFRVGDGSAGWPEPQSFDRIILTAAAPSLPAPLVAQLAERGVLVAPVGGGSSQTLVVAEKYRGKLIERVVCGCRFVRLIGMHGFHQ
ncbi:MAG: protein-L-isoaspartate(D-aspartate) O-methyltransferase [Sedimentisphaerales bacterium]|jgi:protein-L-isoaspartate(D-aspartate) O-methyltransferase|nr:protein-L-isoaspartate(D-aspartate) O-methyltransferase [Sedimentisphaerales bacterium]NLT77789.1 protein-L-isoaspartate(D-aspartate) O-methyltransferase [Planctomycetota bacterium]